jgi:CheY-like chemotaxis protein
MIELKRILLVEDDPKDIELTLAALGEYHLANEVVTARDGAEALDYLRRQGPFVERAPGKPAVVFLDLKLPKLNGLEVLREIKADPELKTIPVVVLTSSRESADLKTCYELGVNAYVVKPVKFNNFLKAVKDIGAFWAILNEAPPGSIRREA